MIELSRHIEILLLNNDCVIVPDLGGFMAHAVDARYDEHDGLFLPPFRTLGFNPQLKINDSLLVQSYIEAYDISYPEAIRRIEGEVAELKQHLQNDGSYELNDIGTLAINEDGHLLFTPFEAGILTPSLYGLSSFEMQRQGGQEIQDSQSARIIELQPEDSDKQEAVEEESDEDVVRIKFTWIRNAAAIAAVLLAVFLIALPTGKTELMTRTISNLNSNILFGGMMSKDTNTTKIDVRKADSAHLQITPDTILKPVVGTESEKPVADSLRQGYCIVLASYVTKRNAQYFVENLKKRGYADAEIYVHNNITRVIYGKFATEADAYPTLRRMHGEKDLTEAWVYHFN